MKIFAILYCFPPLLVPATMCYLKVVMGLRELGHNVDVLTIVPESFRPPGEHMIDPSLNQLVPDGVVRHEVWSWENHRLLRRLRDIGIVYRLGYRFWEPRKREWVFPALRLVRQLDFSAFDVVLSCSQPHSNHLIGLHLKRKLRIPWLAYFSDPWSDMPWQDHRSAAVARYNLRWEHEVMEAADAALFTSSETVHLVMKKYPMAFRDKVGVLPHCFVPEWYGLKCAPAGQRRAKVEILHTGHFYGERTPLPAFEALTRLHRENDLTGRLHVTCVGGMPEQYKRYLTDAGLDSVVTVRSTMPYLDSLSLMQSVDYLLVIDAPLRRTDESIFLPSKLIDYLGSGKPVLGITPARGATARVLRETGNLLADVGDAEQTYRLFGDVVSGRAGTSSDRERVKEYHYLATCRSLTQQLERVAGRRQQPPS